MPRTQVFTDNFNRADSTTLGGSWGDQWGSGGKIKSNRLCLTHNGSGGERAVYNTAVNEKDLEVEFVFQKNWFTHPTTAGFAFMARYDQTKQIGGAIRINYTADFSGVDGLTTANGFTLGNFTNTGAPIPDTTLIRFWARIYDDANGHCIAEARLFDAGTNAPLTGLLSSDFATPVDTDTVGGTNHNSGNFALFQTAIENAVEVPIDDIFIYSYTSETDGPTFTSASTNKAGNLITIVPADANLPISPSTGITGISFTVDGVAVAATSAIRNSSGHIEAVPASTVPYGSVLRVLYSGGNITDALGNAMATISAPGLLATNNSRLAATTTLYGKQVIGTRGFARASQEGVNTAENGKEAWGQFRIEFPYGAAAGWQLYWMGLSHVGASDTIRVRDSGAILVNPGSATVNHDFTYSGAGSIDLAPNTFVGNDADTPAMVPGGIAFVRYVYRNTSPTGILPRSNFLFCAESTTGAKDYDAVTTGAYGSFTDIYGDIPVQQANPLWAGAGHVARAYAPAFVIGRAHPNFPTTINRHALMTVGNSIDVSQDDYDNGTVGNVFSIYGSRGHQGRAFEQDYPYVVFGQGGSVYGGFLGAATTELGYFLLGGGTNNHSRKVTHGWHGYAENEIMSPSTIASTYPTNPHQHVAEFLWDMHEQIAAIWETHDLPHFISTTTPIAKGSYLAPDVKWGATNAEVVEDQLLIANNQVRSDYDTLPGTCLGYTDQAEFTETDPVAGSNTWISALTGDGLHPNSDGHEELKQAWFPVLEIIEDNPNEVPLELIAGTASIVDATETTIQLNATDATGGSTPYTYQWRRSATENGTYTNVSGATTRAYTNTGLTAGTEYWYELRYTDADGATATSARISATTDAASTITGVDVTPSPVTMNGGTTQGFTAVVSGTGSFSTAGTWTASPNVGSIASPSALTTNYTAPAAGGSIQTINLTYTSTQDGTKSDFAVITVPAAGAPSPTVTDIDVTPETATVNGGETQQFSAVVNGTNSPSQTVVWSVVGSEGSINSSGLFTAPVATSSEQTITVRATSTVSGYTGVFGTATVTVPAETPTGGTCDAEEIAAAVWAYSNKIVRLDLTQPIPNTNTEQTTGDALLAARAQGFGRWAIVGNTLTMYAADGTTIVRQFTIDDPANPSSRT